MKRILALLPAIASWAALASAPEYELGVNLYSYYTGASNTLNDIEFTGEVDSDQFEGKFKYYSSDFFSRTQASFEPAFALSEHFTFRVLGFVDNRREEFSNTNTLGASSKLTYVYSPAVKLEAETGLSRQQTSNTYFAKLRTDLRPLEQLLLKGRVSSLDLTEPSTYLEFVGEADIELTESLELTGGFLIRPSNPDDATFLRQMLRAEVAVNPYVKLNGSLFFDQEGDKAIERWSRIGVAYVF